MLATWRDDPDDRPTFTQLASIMGDFLEENVKQVKTKTLFFLVVTQLHVNHQWYIIHGIAQKFIQKSS